MAVQVDTQSILTRLHNSAGKSGAAATGLVVVAAFASGEGFSFAVFALAFAALTVVWARTWVLLPLHHRHQDAEREMWDRFKQSDWRFVGTLCDLTGTELDSLRGLFASADNAGLSGFLESRAPGFSEEEIAGFVRYFCRDWMDDLSIDVDAAGQIRLSIE